MKGRYLNIILISNRENTLRSSRLEVRNMWCPSSKRWLRSLPLRMDSSSRHYTTKMKSTWPWGANPNQINKAVSYNHLTSTSRAAMRRKNMPISQLQIIRSMRFVHFKFQMSLAGACSHFRRNSTSFVFLMFCLFSLCTIVRRSCYSLAYLRMLKWTMLGWESMSMDDLDLERILSWNRIWA